MRDKREDLKRTISEARGLWKLCVRAGLNQATVDARRWQIVALVEELMALNEGRPANVAYASPVVGSSDWVGDCERRYRMAMQAEILATNALTSAELAHKRARSETAEWKRAYEAAKSPTVGVQVEFPRT